MKIKYQISKNVLYVKDHKLNQAKIVEIRADEQRVIYILQPSTEGSRFQIDQDQLYSSLDSFYKRKITSIKNRAKTETALVEKLKKDFVPF